MLFLKAHTDQFDLHRQGSPDGPFRIIFASDIGAPQSHYGIANMLVNSAPMRGNQGIDALPERVHHLADIFRIHSFRNAGKTADIGKKHSHQAAFASRAQSFTQDVELLAQSCQGGIYHLIAQDGT